MYINTLCSSFGFQFFLIQVNVSLQIYCFWYHLNCRNSENTLQKTFALLLKNELSVKADEIFWNRPLILLVVRSFRWFSRHDFIFFCGRNHNGCPFEPCQNFYMFKYDRSKIFFSQHEHSFWEKFNKIFFNKKVLFWK